ncbi:dihydrodipicolinate synthase family protein [Caulobacter sp. S45]|uniref:dihydrodipicolinate synthase family protein n=1 Tax=Caulobacter sp. S45 TaxID=1641861 RepID=UPI00131B4081|nr:dihydrodipicolinate synthase family protein [Caulobacter sp. S45]
MTLPRGLVAFPITPMDVDGRVDCVTLRRLVRRLVDAEVDAIGVLGSTGSYPYLTREERRRALDAALAEADGRTPVMAGVGALRTNDAIALAQDAKAAGAHSGLLAPVSYTPLTEDEVFVHFQAVAQSTDLPLCIYNNPGTTHFSFSEALIERLSWTPNIAGVKNPAPEAVAAPDSVASLRGRVPAHFSIGYSTDWNATEALIAGGDAWYSVLAGLFPSLCMDIRRAVQRGELEQARRQSQHLEPFWSLFKAYGGLRVVYAAANMIGVCDAIPPAPILPLSGEAARQVADALRGALLRPN